MSLTRGVVACLCGTAKDGGVDSAYITLAQLDRIIVVQIGDFLSPIERVNQFSKVRVVFRMCILMSRVTVRQSAAEIEPWFGSFEM